MEIALRFSQIIGAAAIVCATLSGSAAYAGTIYNYTFDGQNNHGSYTATVSLFSQGGQALSGGGSITGGGLTGSQSLTLITLNSPGVEICRRRAVRLSF